MYVWPGLDYSLLSRVFILVLLAAGVAVLAMEKQGIQVLRAAYFLVGLLLIFMPAALHPWYVILILPFLVFFPSPAWLVFSITVALSYVKYVSSQGIMAVWVLLAEYVPLFSLLAAGYFWRIKEAGHSR